MSGLTSQDIIKSLSGAWENNSIDYFTKLFHKDALIYHPYFNEPIGPIDAMEVMNTAVSGSSTVENVKLLKGTGDGNNDLIQIDVIDMGNQLAKINYVGLMPIEFEIKDHKIKSLKIKHGSYKKINDYKKDFTKTDKIRSSLQISILLANYWGGNEEEEYLDLFSEDAKIKHILFDEPASPEIVVDIMNCNVLGITKLYSFEITQGNGEGLNDIVRLKFLETGDLVGYTPKKQGLMNIEIIIKDYKIKYMEVLGYEIINL